MIGPDGTNQGYDTQFGARSLLLSAYAIGRVWYVRGIPVDAPGVPIDSRRTTHSAAYHLHELGLLLRVGIDQRAMRHKGVKPVNVDEMVKKWRVAVVGLAVAHDKDEADRHEASIEDILMPLLSAPIKQIREFAPKLLEVLKNDPQVPFLVWRSYEAWFEDIFAKLPDEGAIQLKTELATEIAQLVESDVKEQLPEAIVRALRWRPASALANVKEVVQQEKAAGNKVRLRGRESCLFIEAGGTEEKPAVCIQV
jgi:hypothetical protein